MTASSMSKGFFEFVKSIGEAKSKQEEDNIIEGELHVLKSKMAGRNVGDRQMREYLIRMVYVEMLGHDASFGHIHAVKLTRARKLVNKRVGYMACSLCLHKDHELMLLLVGGLQTDLQSQNQLEVATALIVCCKLINEDTIPAVLPLVTKLLNHNESTIRKKAIMTIQRFHQLNNSSVTEISDKAKRMLCDKDPSVMGSALHLLLDLIEDNINDFTDLVSSFVSILKQIIEHRLPKDYDYHRMPAPWIQIKLLQILAMLGTANKTASEGMYEVLHEVMRRADIGINVGYAIIYECVRTVTTIYPNTQLLAEAAKCTSRFITSENHNLKYLGINALASIVQVNPDAANEHQMVVIDCLEDRDETLRRKTLDLLYRMTNEHNVSVICNKLINSLKDSVDVFLRTELVEKITSLAEKFAPDTIWFVETMSDVFELGAELVKPQFAHNFVTTLAEGIAENVEDEDAEEDVKQYAADFFYEVLNTKTRIPTILMKIVCWVLGEYGEVCSGQAVTANNNNNESKEDGNEDEDEQNVLGPLHVIRKLWLVIEMQASQDLSIRQWAMSATCKLSKHLRPIPRELEAIVTKYQTSTHSDLVQLSHEFIALVQERELMDAVFDRNSIVDEINIDRDLKFLDAFVSRRVEESDGRLHGYGPPQSSEYLDDHEQEKPSGIKFVNTPDPADDLGLRGGGGGGGGHGNRNDMFDVERDDGGHGNNDAFDARHNSPPSSRNLGGGGFQDRRGGGSGGGYEQQQPQIGGGGGGGGSNLKKVQGSWGQVQPQRPAAVNNRNDADNELSGNAVLQLQENKYGKSVISVAVAVENPYSVHNHGNEYEQQPASPPQSQQRVTEKPRERTAREQKAFELFGGSASSSASKRPRRLKRKRKSGSTAAAVTKRLPATQAVPQPAEQQQPPPAAQAPQESGDLFEMMSGGSSAAVNAQPTPAQQPPPQQQQPNNEIFDIFGSGGGNSNANNTGNGNNTAQQPQSQSNLISDIFDDLTSTSNNTGQQSSQGVQNAGPDMTDIFGSLLSNNNTNENNSNRSNVNNNMGGGGGGGNSAAKGYAALESQLRAKLVPYGKSHAVDQIVHSSDLQVSYFKVYKQQQSTLCLFLSHNNLCGHLQSVRISVKIDNQYCSLQLGFDVGNSVPNPSLINSKIAVLQQLNAHATACQMISFGALNPVQIQMPTNILVTISYAISGGGATKTIQVQIPLNISDLLRATVISTNDFGVNWQKLQKNAQQLVLQNSVGCRSIEDYVHKITSELNVHHIQTIGFEVIAAASITSLQNRSLLVPCLIHCKHDGGNNAYTLQIRTSSMAVTKAIALQMQILLQ